MNKLYPFIICCIISFSSYSQIILIDQVVFEPGDNITVVFDDVHTDEGSDGQNVVWDYSQASGIDSITWIGVDPLDHDIAQEYWPDSDLGAFIPAPNNDTIEFKTFEFYDFGLNRIATLGSYSILRDKITNQADTQIVNYAQDPFEEFEFPMAYLDEFESDYSGTVTGSFQGFETETKRGGNVIMKADATGTIHTPTGTYDNVLRVKRIETRYDTSFFEAGGETFESVIQTENILYDWLQPERKFTLYRIINTTITFQGMPPQNTDPVAFYTIENGVSDVNDYSDIPEIKVYPNPTQDILSIENFDDLEVKSIEVYNVSGSQVMLDKTPSKQISLSCVIPGNYIIKFVTDRGTYSQQIVKM